MSRIGTGGSSEKITVSSSSRNADIVRVDKSAFAK